MVTVAGNHTGYPLGRSSICFCLKHLFLLVKVK
jgi:hypothetical protein